MSESTGSNASSGSSKNNGTDDESSTIGASPGNPSADASKPGREMRARTHGATGGSAARKHADEQMRRRREQSRSSSSKAPGGASEGSSSGPGRSGRAGSGIGGAVGAAGGAKAAGTTSKLGAGLAKNAAGAAISKIGGPKGAKPSGDDAGSEGKQALKDVAAGAAQGALQGAAGGVAGAAAGAAKGAAVSAVRNRTTRRVIIGLAVVIVAVMVGVLTLPMMLGGALVSALGGSQEQGTTRSVEQSEDENVRPGEARQIGDEHQLPWYLVASIQAQKKEGKSVDDWSAEVARELDKVDKERRHRDLRTGGLAYSDKSYLVIPAADTDPRHQAAEQVREVHLQALQGAGFTEGEAGQIYDRALSWALGEDQCTSGGGDSGEIVGDQWVYGGETYTKEQVAIMRTIIGIAKAMQPGKEQEAAIIGLITARVESRFQNYANDGVVTDLDRSNTPASQLEHYSKLEYSLTLPHDAVGTDHSSVGIVQQQVIGGSWGTVGESDWKTDIEGVIKRLMNPAFSIARFYEAMGKIPGWDTQPPGDVAQDVQVSAFPDKYEKQIELAKAIWQQFGADTPALALPDGIGGIGSPEIDDKPAGCRGGTGDGTVPSGTDQELAQEIMAAAAAGKVLWWEPAARDQIGAYANGEKISPACTLDTGVLQALVMATRMYDVFSINSLNRRCVDDHAGTGTASYHWKGKAIDFGHFNGIQVTGSDPESIRFILAFDKVAPRDSGVGQLDCRGWQKITTMREFKDTCHHLHIEIGLSSTTLGDTPAKPEG